MKSQFTPGPWGRHDTNIYVGDTVLVCCPKNHWSNIELPEAEKLANAHLIASAPELLAALERLVHPMADDDDLDYAREVIRKARGGQP